MQIILQQLDELAFVLAVKVLGRDDRLDTAAHAGSIPGDIGPRTLLPRREID
jgi:hypothetical protein